MSGPSTPTVAHEETVHGAGHAHPGDRTYMGVAVFLAIVTAIEVALYYVDIGDFAIPSLIVLMIIKFIVVAGWFMHLKFDSVLFRRLFVGGLVLAIAVDLAFMTAMQFFGDDTTSEIRDSHGVPAAPGS